MVNLFGLSGITPLLLPPVFPFFEETTNTLVFYPREDDRFYNSNLCYRLNHLITYCYPKHRSLLAWPVPVQMAHEAAKAYAVLTVEPQDRPSPENIRHLKARLFKLLAGGKLVVPSAVHTAFQANPEGRTFKFVAKALELPVISEKDSVHGWFNQAVFEGFQGNLTSLQLYAFSDFDPLKHTPYQAWRWRSIGADFHTKMADPRKGERILRRGTFTDYIGMVITEPNMTEVHGTRHVDYPSGHVYSPNETRLKIRRQIETHLVRLHDLLGYDAFKQIVSEQQNPKPPALPADLFEEGALLSNLMQSIEDMRQAKQRFAALHKESRTLTHQVQASSPLSGKAAEMQRRKGAALEDFFAAADSMASYFVYPRQNGLLRPENMDLFEPKDFDLAFELYEDFEGYVVFLRKALADLKQDPPSADWRQSLSQTIFYATEIFQSVPSQYWDELARGLLAEWGQGTLRAARLPHLAADAFSHCHTYMPDAKGKASDICALQHGIDPKAEIAEQHDNDIDKGWNGKKLTENAKRALCASWAIADILAAKDPADFRRKLQIYLDYYWPENLPERGSESLAHAVILTPPSKKGDHETALPPVDMWQRMEQALQR